MGPRGRATPYYPTIPSPTWGMMGWLGGSPSNLVCCTPIWVYQAAPPPPGSMQGRGPHTVTPDFMVRTRCCCQPGSATGAAEATWDGGEEDGERGTRGLAQRAGEREEAGRRRAGKQARAAWTRGRDCRHACQRLCCVRPKSWGLTDAGAF